MFGQKLLELRKKRNLTHEDLAKYLNITRQAYSFYESGKHEMNFESLRRIAGFYNVTTDYLLGLSEITNAPFDDEELNLIDRYRLLDSRGKNAVKATINAESLYTAKKSPQ
ncbi:MAG: helix-turn-helix domain-containing protein [Clostridiales bacterium]|nr:helix-turn-helix domain-containing protein [Clostridiales bacterium]